MAGYWELPERCRSCNRKRNNGTSNKATYACYCLPYWGKTITPNMECPKDMENGGSLKSVCKVNTER